MVLKNDIIRMSQKTDIMKVIEHYDIKLQRESDDRMKGLCPFHSENTPSFKVYPEENSWYTYCCHKGTTPYHLILELELNKGGDDVRDRAVKVLQLLSGEGGEGCDSLQYLDRQLEEVKEEQSQISVQFQHQLISTFIRDWLYNSRKKENYKDLELLAEKCFQYIDKYFTKDSVKFNEVCRKIKRKLLHINNL